MVLRVDAAARVRARRAGGKRSVASEARRARWVSGRFVTSGGRISGIMGIVFRVDAVTGRRERSPIYGLRRSFGTNCHVFRERRISPRNAISGIMGIVFGVNAAARARGGRRGGKRAIDSGGRNAAGFGTMFLLRRVSFSGANGATVDSPGQRPGKPARHDRAEGPRVIRPMCSRGSAPDQVVGRAVGLGGRLERLWRGGVFNPSPRRGTVATAVQRDPKEGKPSLHPRIESPVFTTPIGKVFHIFLKQNSERPLGSPAIRREGRGSRHSCGPWTGTAPSRAKCSAAPVG